MTLCSHLVFSKKVTSFFLSEELLRKGSPAPINIKAVKTRGLSEYCCVPQTLGRLGHFRILFRPAARHVLDLDSAIYNDPDRIRALSSSSLGHVDSAQLEI